VLHSSTESRTEYEVPVLAEAYVHCARNPTSGSAINMLYVGP